ncbi:MAG: SUMF1/EgtB/PvdO family nonheme iron enzyme [Kordiimonadaceae bacterium]|nr:SUMF1/EgtB/PvdO family nonheme iron enzyme [Kordiimonadaceae bacterium]MBO6567537.1 SUMF1/EgtB/PvdO family nonheme iron enzyme [Kordiimonadaceae bacterium]MBO6963249.1 SUMF1/EgtB/PvdO family nonheme iron enzyme [Kordiimonadaceae bacterium]
MMTFLSNKISTFGVSVFSAAILLLAIGQPLQASEIYRESFFEGLAVSSEVTDINGDPQTWTVVIKLDAKAKFSSIMGEPLNVCSGIWEIDSVSRTNLPANINLSNIPDDVLEKVVLRDVKVAFALWKYGESELDIAHFVCDLGAMTKPGSGKPSFAVPGSTSWEETLYDYGSGFTDVASVENNPGLYAGGFNLTKEMLSDDLVDAEKAKEYLKAALDSEKDRQASDWPIMYSSLASLGGVHAWDHNRPYVVSIRMNTRPLEGWLRDQQVAEYRDLKDKAAEFLEGEDLTYATAELEENIQNMLRNNYAAATPSAPTAANSALSKCVSAGADNFENWQSGYQVDTTCVPLPDIRMARISGGCIERQTFDDLHKPWTSYGSDNFGIHADGCLYVKGFELATTEVTFELFDLYANENDVALPSDEGWGRGNRPVVNISIADANKFIEWLNKETGETYRLPSMFEWFRAYETGFNRLLREPEDRAKFANFGTKRVLNRQSGDFENVQLDSYANTAPVASFSPDSNGVYDLLGNVGELTAGCLKDLSRPINGVVFRESGSDIILYERINAQQVIDNECAGIITAASTYDNGPGRWSNSSSSGYNSAFLEDEPLNLKENYMGFRLARD